MTPKLCGLDEFGGNVTFFDLGAQLRGVEVVRLHGDEIDDPFKRVGGADGVLHRDRVGAQPLTDGVEAVLEVGSELVHLVDEANARDVVAVGLSPDGFGLRFDAFLAVKDRDSAVQDSQ